MYSLFSNCTRSQQNQLVAAEQANVVKAQAIPFSSLIHLLLLLLSTGCLLLCLGFYILFFVNCNVDGEEGY
jgi:hypothetical protein